MHGRERIAKLLASWARSGERAGGFELRPVEVNGQPGALAIDAVADAIIGVLVFDIADGRIQAINSVVNPDKLQHLGPLADPYEFLRRRRKSD